MRLSWRLSTSFICTALLDKKDILAKPEEVVRQYGIYRLMHDYAYPIERLRVEHPITFGRDTSKRADIVVFDKLRPTVPYLIVEVKQAKAKDGKDQLKSYTHATGGSACIMEQSSTNHTVAPEESCWVRAMLAAR